MEMNAKINPSWKRMYTIGGIAWALMAALLGTALDVVLRVIFHATTIVSVGYLHAASDSIRVGYIPFAELMGAVGKTGLSLSGMLSGLGILMMGIAMVGGVFQRTTAYLVIVAGTLLAVGSLAVMFSSAFGLLGMLSDLLALIAMVLIGLRLYSLGRALT